MSDNDFLNRSAPKEHIENDYEYPIIQWNNGYTGATGVLANGGFELPLSQFRDLVAGEILDIPHRNGTVTELGYLLQVMHLAIVQSHTAYYKEQGDNVLWSSTPDFDNGYRSRTLYFCYAAEIEQSAQLTPVILSVKSKVAQEFKALLRAFRSQILATADKLSGNRNAHYFYYVPVGSNGREVQQGGPQGSYTIAPPIPYWDTQISEIPKGSQIDTLRELAIPDYLYSHILESGWDEAKAWQESLASNGGDPTPPPRDPQPSGPAPISPANEAQPISRPPMTEAQAVASAQTMSNEEAQRLFQANVGDAIRAGCIDHITATNLRNDADQVSAWRILSQALNGQAIAA